MTAQSRGRIWSSALGPLAFCAVVLAFVGIGCGGTGTKTSTGSLHGTVLRGPTAPVCRVGVPCSEPAAGATLTFERSGRVYSRVVVAQDGGYSVSLPPGPYVVVQPAPSIGAGIRPSRVRVVAARARRIDFAIDTGIR